MRSELIEWPSEWARLAYTRYCFVYGLLCKNKYYSLHTHPLCRHPPPPSSPILLRNVMFPPDPPLLQYIPYAIGDDNIEYCVKAKGQASRRVWRASASLRFLEVL